MRTEAEAKKCWCPFARTEVLSHVVNRTALGYGDGDGEWRCIASECMAWRWGEAAHWEGDLSGRSPEDTGAVTVRRGYCGLAGKS